MPAAARWSAKSRRNATSIIIAPATPISAGSNPASCRRKYVRAGSNSKRSSPNCSGGFAFDDEVLEWVRDALHASHADERREHEEAIKRHQAEHKRLQDRINAMYVDKLDGLVDTAFFEKMSNQWRKKTIAASEKSSAIKTPINPTRTRALRFSTSPETRRGCSRSRRRAKNAACSTSCLSNCTWEDGEVVATFR